MERETLSFTQETVVAGEPVETQVRVRASSSYVRLVMVGEAGWDEERAKYMYMYMHVLSSPSIHHYQLFSMKVWLIANLPTFTAHIITGSRNWSLANKLWLGE